MGRRWALATYLLYWGARRQDGGTGGDAAASPAALLPSPAPGGPTYRSGNLCSGGRSLAAGGDSRGPFGEPFSTEECGALTAGGTFYSMIGVFDSPAAPEPVSIV